MLLFLNFYTPLSIFHVFQFDFERDSGSSSSSIEDVIQPASAYCDVISNSTSDVIEVPEQSLTQNHVYNITLVVSQGGRERGSMTQMVRLTCN